MPTRDVGRLQKCRIILGTEDAVIRDNPIHRRSQIFVSIEPGIKERHRDPATRKSFVRIQPERRWERSIPFAVNLSLALKMFLSATEDGYATRTDARDCV